MKNYKKIEVIVYDFSHDINGNPTAHFLVKGYLKWENQYPSSNIFETKRRKQIIYSGTVEAFARTAFSHANFDASKFEIQSSFGSRSENKLSISLRVKK